MVERKTVRDKTILDGHGFSTVAVMERTIAGLRATISPEEYAKRELTRKWWAREGRTAFLHDLLAWGSSQANRLDEASGGSTEYFSGEMDLAVTEEVLRISLKHARKIFGARFIVERVKNQEKLLISSKSKVSSYSDLYHPRFIDILSEIYGLGDSKREEYLAFLAT